MNETVNKFFLAGDRFMPEMHLKQPRITYSASGLVTENKERIQKLKIQKWTASDKSSWNKSFNIVTNPTYDRYQRGLASMVYKSFDKKSATLPDKSVSGSCVANNEIKKTYNKLKNYTNQLLENLKEEKFILDLEVIFGELI